MDILLRLVTLFNESNFSSGLDLCNTRLGVSTISSAERAQVSIWKLKFQEKLGKLAEAEKFGELLLLSDHCLQHPDYRANVYTQLAKVFFSQGQMDRVQNALNAAEFLLVAKVDNIKRSNKDLQIQMADVILLRGGYCWNQGDLDTALHNFKLDLEIRQNLGAPLDLANAYNNVGVMYNALGDLTQALKYLKKAYAMYEAIHSTRGISQTGHNIGAILIQLGQLDESLQVMVKSLDIDLNDKYLDGIRVACQNIGEVLWHQGHYQRALKYLSDGLGICQRTMDTFHIAEISIPLLSVQIALKNFSAAQTHRDRVRQCYHDSANLIVQQRYWLAEGLYLKALNTQEALRRAEYYFNKIISDPVRYFDITATALVALAEILIQRLMYGASGTKPDKVLEILEKLIAGAKQAGSYSLAIEAMLIKAQTYGVQGKRGQAQLLFYGALKFAKNHRLLRLEAKILRAIDKFYEMCFNEGILDNAPPPYYLNPQYSPIKGQLQAIFSSQSPNTLYFDPMSPCCLFIFERGGHLSLRCALTSAPEWDSHSLFSNVIEIQIMRGLKQYLDTEAPIQMWQAYKFAFYSIGQLVGCLVYQGDSREAHRKLAALSTVILANSAHYENLLCKAAKSRKDLQKTPVKVQADRKKGQTCLCLQDPEMAVLEDESYRWAQQAVLDIF